MCAKRPREVQDTEKWALDAQRKHSEREREGGGGGGDYGVLAFILISV